MDAMDLYQVYKTWKEEHGHIHYVEMKDIEFYFRLIKRDEYHLLKTIEQNEFKVDELIVRLCVVDPFIEDWSEDIYAGFTSTLAKIILEESLIIPKGNVAEGYIEQVVAEEYNKVMSSFELQMPAIIAKGFPAYTLEEIESWPLTKQVQRYAQAIYILNNIDDYGINFIEDE